MGEKSTNCGATKDAAVGVLVNGGGNGKSEFKKRVACAARAQFDRLGKGSEFGTERMHYENACNHYRDIIIVILAVAFAAAAQDAPAKKSDFAREKKSTARIESRVVPYEVFRKKATTEGIVEQCVLADNPLQLINPLAPASYGNGEQNVVRDPVGGRVSGWKILHVRF